MTRRSEPEAPTRLRDPAWIARCTECGYPTAAAVHGYGHMADVRRWQARGDDVELEEAEVFRLGPWCECKDAS